MKAKRRREGKRKKRKEPRKVWILVRISMIFDFEYGLCVFWTLVGIFMGSKPRV